MLKDELEITADLAALSLSPDERERLAQSVTRMLDFFARMDEVEVEGLEPTKDALLARNRLRPDESESSLSPDEKELLRSNIPETRGSHVAIPNVL